MTATRELQFTKMLKYYFSSSNTYCNELITRIIILYSHVQKLKYEQINDAELQR